MLQNSLFPTTFATLFWGDFLTQNNSEAKMKICIELDEEMAEKWKETKDDVEEAFEFVYEKPIHITDNIVFRCMLYCYEEGTSESFPIMFASSFKKG